MPRTIDTGDIIKSQVICFETVNTSQISINTTYWLAGVPTGAGLIQAQDFADGMDAEMSGIYKPLISAAASYRGVRAQLFRPKPIQRSVSAVTRAGVGTGGANLAPPQISYVVSLYTDDAKIHGRQYVPFPATNDMDANGTPTAGYIGNAAFLTGFLGSTFTITKAGTSWPFKLMVYSPAVVDDDVVPPVVTKPEAFTLVTDITGQDGFGTQRRRGFYGRINSLPI